MDSTLNLTFNLLVRRSNGVKKIKKTNLTSRGQIRPFDRGGLTPMFSDYAGRALLDLLL